MKKACSYCGRIHPKGVTCPFKPKRKYYKDSDAAKFRGTMKWRRTSERIRERDKNICQACLNELGSRIKFVPGEPLQVHHINPIEEAYDERLDDENLISLCSRHHEEAEAGFISKEDLKTIARANTLEDAQL